MTVLVFGRRTLVVKFLLASGPNRPSQKKCRFWNTKSTLFFNIMRFEGGFWCHTKKSFSNRAALKRRTSQVRWKAAASTVKTKIGAGVGGFPFCISFLPSFHSFYSVLSVLPALHVLPVLSFVFLSFLFPFPVFFLSCFFFF